jgi:hypothetical protein
MSVSYGIFTGDTTGFFRVNNAKSYGPYPNGANIYDSGYFATAGANFAKLGVFKSVDNGVTWSQQDATNAPSLTRLAEFYPGSGTVIYFAYLNGYTGAGDFTPRVALASFDMATDLFTIIDNSTGPVLSLNYHNNIEQPSNVPIVQMQLSRLSDGTLAVMYATINVHYDLYVQTYKAGVWASAQQLNTNAPAQSGYGPYGLGVTSNDKLYCLWLSGDDGFLYSSLLHGGTLDAPVLAAGVNVANNSGGEISWATSGYYESGTDSLIWNFPVRAFPNVTPKLLVAATASGTASFSLIDPGITGVLLGDTRGNMDFVGGGSGSSKYSVYYQSAVTGTGPYTITVSLVTAASLSGPWSSPSVAWDYPTDTINPNYTISPLSTPPLEIFFASRLTNGVGFVWGIPADIPGTIGIGESGTAYFLSPPAPPLGFTIACPVNNSGIVGIPYTGFLVGAGGTPPYTFAITFGSLPPGITLNTATGELSGIPTVAGNYSFGVSVTDSLGNPASNTCDMPPVPPVTGPPPNPGVGIVIFPVLCPRTFLPNQGGNRTSSSANGGGPPGTCPPTFLPNRGGNRFN